MNEQTWRHTSDSAARWFNYLASTGYNVAGIEQRVIDDAERTGDLDAEQHDNPADEPPDDDAA